MKLNHTAQNIKRPQTSHVSKMPFPLPARSDKATDRIRSSLPTAIVYCEGNFARIDGKTANGLVRHSEAYLIHSVIDSTLAGQDSGLVLDGIANGVPIHADLEGAIGASQSPLHTLIYGMAPSSGKLSVRDRAVVLKAISDGMNVVCGLHEYLGDDVEIAEAAKSRGVKIRDIRKPRASKDLRLFDGSIQGVRAIRIAVLGTDCAIGKRTTATVLVRALNAMGIRTVLVGTGQTGLMQGAKYGVALDAVPPQFCCGELEREIVDADRFERPDVIVIEGQGALSHPAFCTSAFILRGSRPQAVILQHAPNRSHRCDFPNMPMPDPKSEITLIEAFSPTRVIGLTINHEAMGDEDLSCAIAALTRGLNLPVTDALSRPAAELAQIVVSAFPDLQVHPVEVA